MNELVEVLSDVKLGIGIGKLVSSLLFGNDSDYRMDALNDGFKSIQSNKYQDAIRLFSRIKEKDPLWMRTISSYGLSLAYALKGEFEKAYYIVHEIVKTTESDNDPMFFAKNKRTIKEWRVYCEELEDVIREELLRKNPKYLRNYQRSELLKKLVLYLIAGVVLAAFFIGALGVLR